MDDCQKRGVVAALRVSNPRRAERGVDRSVGVPWSGDWTVPRGDATFSVRLSRLALATDYSLETPPVLFEMAEGCIGFMPDGMAGWRTARRLSICAYYACQIINESLRVPDPFL